MGGKSPHKQSKLVRIIINLKTDDDGLFLEPAKYDEVQESHLRDTFVNMFHYADSEQGNPRTFDRKGNYLCKDCNKYEPSACVAVEGEISGKSGSCQHWEDKTAGDSELEFGKKIDKEFAGYGETTNPGYGCRRCEYAIEAKATDSVGRDLFCRRGGMRVMRNACCALNDSEAVTEFEGNEPKEESE